MSQFSLLSLILILFFTHAAFSKADPKSLRLAIPYSLPPPLLIMKNGKPEGIVKDYAQEISKKINREFNYIVVPKIRIHEMISKGLAEVNCYTSPLWIPEPQKYTWSKTLFFKKEVVATLKKPPTSLSDIKGQRIGTVTRYVYPHLDPLFENKRLIREDVSTEEQNLQKLITKRIDYVVADEMQLDYFLKNHKNEKIVVNRLVINEYPIHCLIASEDPNLLKSFNEAIDEIKKSDRLQKIFDRYK